MNMNGRDTTKCLAELKAARQIIGEKRAAGHRDGAEWMLKPATGEKYLPMLQGLAMAFDDLTKQLWDKELWAWYAWAYNHMSPDLLRGRLGYDAGWSMMPAVVLEAPPAQVRRVVDARTQVPFLYLLAKDPQEKDVEIEEYVPRGLEAKPMSPKITLKGVQLKTVEYAVFEEGWFQVHVAQKPSRSALQRAVRLWILSTLVNREVATSKSLLAYEVLGIRKWMVGETGEVLPTARRTLTRLVSSPKLAGKLNGTSRKRGGIDKEALPSQP